ncbi:MAG: FG-GAP repeat protein [Flavobacteriales bacterium]|nr:FG-GAP repeat protein [Flavobacteriales bacterium]
MGTAMIVGEYFYTNGVNTHTGRAYVFQGSPFSGLSAVANTIIEGTQLDGQMGISVCAAGDVNGDGFGDVIVGAHLQSMFYLNQGMASVHLGSAAGTSATAAWSVYGTGTDQDSGPGWPWPVMSTATGTVTRRRGR